MEKKNNYYDFFTMIIGKDDEMMIYSNKLLTEENLPLGTENSPDLFT